MSEAPGGHGIEAVRAATRTAHDRLDSLVDLRAWDAATHQWWLQRMLGLHEPLEADLGAWQAQEQGSPDLASRRRAGAIASDLRNLGLSEDAVRGLPRSPLPPSAAQANNGLARGRALGQLYVLDGSALGGAVIATHAIAGGIPQNACTSLAHSKERILSWRETKTLLDDLSPAELNEAVRAAVELFAVFEAWLRTPAPGNAVL